MREDLKLLFLKKVMLRLAGFFRNLSRFYIPNIFFIARGQLKLKNNLNCIQRTLLTGKGRIDIGSNCSFGYKMGGFFYGAGIEIQARLPNSHIRIGHHLSTNNNVFFCSSKSITLGDNCLIGQNVTIMDFEAHSIHPDFRNNVGEIGEVVLGDNIWIGNNVTILKNTFIGDNVIVAAGAVVSGTFEKNCIIGGVPAKVIKYINID